MSQRDPRLVAALRHAPDRHAEPPPVLDQRILDQARRGSRVAAPRHAWQVLQDLLQALTRPAAGAALASVVLATTVVLLWRDGSPPSTDGVVVSEAPAPPATALPAAPEPPTMPAPAAAAPQTAPKQTAKIESAPQAQRARPASELQVAAQSAATAPVAQATVAADRTATPAAASPAPPAPPAPPPVEGKTAADTLSLSGTAAGAAAQRSQARAFRSSAVPREEGAPPEGLSLALQAPGPIARALHDLASRPDRQATWAHGWRAAERFAPASTDLPLRDTSDKLLGHLRLEADAVVWLPVAGSAARLTLNAAALSPLRSAATIEAANPPPPR